MSQHKINNENRPTRVFISYSRKDSTFAERLRDDLIALGFAAYLDQHDIHPGEPWKKRLSGLIQTADSVAFCLSSHFVDSEICDWEITEAERLGKRLLPIVAADTSDASVPLRLRRLNYIFMRNSKERDAGLDKFVIALKTDIEWVREHTRWGELAHLWNEQGRSRDLLTRGSALIAMQAWSQQASESKPPLTDEMVLYISESEKEQFRLGKLRRRTIIALGTLTLLTALVALGWWQQKFLREIVHWYVVMKPSILSEQRERELALSPGSQFADCRNGCPTMIVMGPGTFLMGSSETRFPRERPQHSVTIRRAFAVALHETTFEEWDHCVASGHCRSGVTSSGWGRGKQPVINVTWEDAKQYVKWLSKVTKRRYRLPSEAEWEYVARAGSQEYFSFGKVADDLNTYGWFADNADNRTHPVGQKPANKFGLKDVHGNVSEWTEDCANDTYAGAPKDGSAWLQGNCLSRVFRGGSWLYGARMARSANRDWLVGDDRKDYIGFRVVRDFN